MQKEQLISLVLTSDTGWLNSDEVSLSTARVRSKNRVASLIGLPTWLPALCGLTTGSHCPIYAPMRAHVACPGRASVCAFV